MEVSLNVNEIKIAELLANARIQSCRDAGKPNWKAGPQSEWQTDLSGVAGELAYAKSFNLYPDVDTNPGSYDISHCGHRVDVKTTKYPFGRLEVSTKIGNSDCDVYALVTGEIPDFKVIGWKYASDVLEESNIYQHRNGSKVYRVEQDDLNKFDPLMTKVFYGTSS